MSLQRKIVIRYSLFALSLLLGVAIYIGDFYLYEVPYVALFQQAILRAKAMYFFQIITYLGDSLTWVGLTLLLLAINIKNPRQVLKLGLTLAIVWAAVTVLRYTLNYPRPFQRFPTLVTTYTSESAPSYPSGHTATTVGGFYILANHQRLLYVLSCSLVVLVALSRVVLGLHYFSDLLGGVLLSYPLAATFDDLQFFKRFK